MKSIFFYGSLRDRDLLEVVLDRPVNGVELVPARAEDVEARAVATEAYPVLLDRPGAVAEGMLLRRADRHDLDRLAYYEEAEYVLKPIEVLANGTRVEALVFRPTDKPRAADRPWDFAHWQAVEKPGALHVAREYMDHMGRTPLSEIDRYWPGIKIRGRQQALAESAPRPDGTGLRSAFGPGDLRIGARRRSHTGYLAVQDLTLEHRRFDGSWSGPMDRSAVLWGDAVTVLPWDPRTDLVLLIEQFRAGPAARGDTSPWCIEVVAGRIDTDESPEAVARREAGEEAGLTLGRMERIGGSYPTPGLAAEHLTAFVAEADLAAAAQGLHGVATEHEDIRTMILPLDAALAAVDRDEVNTGPALVSLLWLARHRERLRALWAAGPA